MGKSKRLIRVRLSEAFDELAEYKRASGRQPNTLAEYRNVHRIVQIYFTDDPILSNLSLRNWQGFFVWLRDEYRCGGRVGVAVKAEAPLAEKSLKNIHTVLSALYTWAVNVGCAEKHLIRQIEIRQPHPKLIFPYSENEIRAMILSVENSREYNNGSKSISNRRPTHLRDRAILLMLLDTGIRAEELCNLTVKDINLRLHRAVVWGKGREEQGTPRSVYSGTRLKAALWEYLKSFDEPLEDNDPLFPVVRNGHRTHMSRNTLYQLIRGIADRAGVKGATVHRFRHTFAINYLRNGGNIYSLMDAMGHSTLSMVKRYLRIAERDRRSDADKASPADHWKL